MKKIVFKQDIINYLYSELNKLEKKPANLLSDIKNQDFCDGYKEGQIAATRRILNYIHVYMGI